MAVKDESFNYEQEQDIMYASNIYHTCVGVGCAEIDRVAAEMQDVMQGLKEMLKLAVDVDAGDDTEVQRLMFAIQLIAVGKDYSDRFEDGRSTLDKTLH